MNKSKSFSRYLDIVKKLQASYELGEITEAECDNDRASALVKFAPDMEINELESIRDSAYERYLEAADELAKRGRPVAGLDPKRPN